MEKKNRKLHLFDIEPKPQTMEFSRYRIQEIAMSERNALQFQVVLCKLQKKLLLEVHEGY